MMTDTAMPASAPTGACQPWLCWKMASRKKTDSRPSRATARKTMPMSAQPAASVPWPSARSTEACRSPLMLRAVLRIQNTMEVSMPTAMRPTTPSKSSCSFCGNSAAISWSAAPANSDSALASSTPTQTAGIRPSRPLCFR